MTVYLPTELRQQLLAVDNHSCAYCQTLQANSGYPMVVDHIIPQSNGGLTEFNNLCFSCRRCNEFKGATTNTKDPLTNAITPLFHPRKHKWEVHFEWEASGIRLLGLTAIGRVTILTLKMNNAVIQHARRNWVSVGWHPPNYNLGN